MLCALVCCACAAPAARAADPIMRLADVRPGMSCTALTVVQGTNITTFRASVIDVIRGDSSDSGPRILVRVSGPAVDQTGIGPGFSGSPIYCPAADGTRRNAGAISESVGDYGGKVALATPIEEILGQGPEAPGSASTRSSVRRAARPLAGPLTVSGLSAPLRRALRRASRRSGRPALAAPAGPASGFPVQDLRPGAAVAASLATGDLGLGTIGTVAYRNGSAIWAFGHSLDGVGQRSLPLQDAYVYSVINNPVGLEDLSTYKLAAPGHTVGAMTNDTLNAIAGRLGPAPRTIAVRIDAVDADSGRTITLRSQVSDERALDLGSGLDLVSELGLGQAITSALGSSPERLRSSLCLRVRVAERKRRLGFCDRYVDPSSPLDDASSALGLIEDYSYGPLTPLGVYAKIRLRRRVPEAFLLSARAPARARAGSRIRIRLALRRKRGATEKRSVFLRLPRTLTPGDRVITLRGTVPSSLNGSLEDVLAELFGGGEDDTSGDAGDSTGPTSIAELARLVSAVGKPDGLRASFSRKGKGVVVLPASRVLVRGKLQVPLRVLKPKR
jgi:hypothetical protein